VNNLLSSSEQVEPAKLFATHSPDFNRLLTELFTSEGEGLHTFLWAWWRTGKSNPVGPSERSYRDMLAAHDDALSQLCAEAFSAGMAGVSWCAQLGLWRAAQIEHQHSPPESVQYRGDSSPTSPQADLSHPRQFPPGHSQTSGLTRAAETATTHIQPTKTRREQDTGRRPSDTAGRDKSSSPPRDNPTLREQPRKAKPAEMARAPEGPGRRTPAPKGRQGDRTK
jgi:hypothetical protein